MKKIKVLLVSLIALFTLIIATSSNTEAATWYKGTPKIIRGDFKGNTNDPNDISQIKILF